MDSGKSERKQSMKTNGNHWHHPPAREVQIHPCVEDKTLAARLIAGGALVAASPDLPSSLQEEQGVAPVVIVVFGALVGGLVLLLGAMHWLNDYLTRLAVGS